MQSCLWCVEGVGTDNAQLTRYMHDINIEVAGEYEYWFYTGYANTETGTKIDVNTLFQAGSISKPLAALAALKLFEND